MFLKRSGQYRRSKQFIQRYPTALSDSSSGKKKGRKTIVSGTNGQSKLWGGRFSGQTHELVDALNASLPFDRRLARQDITGSVAHAFMLGKQGIIRQEDARTIADGLQQVFAEIEAEDFEYRLSDEDIHMAVERRLGEIIGPAAGRLHTARSRNDQVALDLRLWAREAVTELSGAVLDAAGALLDLGDREQDAIMPGYTHLQRAQPILFSHHMHAYATMLLRDADRLADTYRRLNVLPLGAGALAGVTHPIDREAVARMLGFDAISENSLDAVADRDHISEMLFDLTLIATHLSRLAEELILWSTSEFNFIEFDDAFSTGSSIMPQKKNADIAELMRGKFGRVFGALVGLLSVVKGLPMTYNKDLQEDKEGLFDALDTVLALLRILPPMLDTLTINRETMAEAAIGGFSLATDVADELARRGLPFREAHEIVGQLVARCISEGRTLESLSPEEWAGVSDAFAESPPVVTLEASVAARYVPGGTAPGQVRAAYGRSRQSIVTRQQQVAGWRDALPTLESVSSASHSG
jgi:argininosuccinate lyase